MDNSSDYIQLVKLARLGNKQSLDALVQMVRGRLYAHVYRIMLRDDATQDIVQECMLEMVRILDKLEKAERFWPWLCGIALNKIRRYYAEKKRNRAISISEFGGEDLYPSEPSQKQSGLASLVSEEVKQVVYDAMRKLRPQHRAVLAMRCYEKMGYSQIAESMECSEITARVLFFRAKKSLMKQLSRSGFRKEFLIAALILFGKMTAPTEAAVTQVSVTAAGIRVGMAASLAGIATGKVTAIALKTAVVPLIAVGGLTVGTKMPTTWVDKTAEWADKTTNTIQQKLVAPDSLFQTRRAGEEYWYYYPSDTDDAVMIRHSSYDPEEGKFSYNLQNELANYYFDDSEGIIYINNYRMYNSDLTVKRLPTDDTKLRQFISAVEGTTDTTEYIPSSRDGLFVIVRQNKNDNIGLPQVTQHYNVLDEEYFRHNWPVDAQVVDNRDVMHQRGWTYFRVSGQINGRKISGRGRIPFVHATSRKNYPWLKLDVAEEMEIIDGIHETHLFDAAKGMLIVYSTDSFFGLSRPWLGLHTIDTIRRDAAKQRIPFETRYTPLNTKAEVVLTKKTEKGQLQLVYTIDLKNDVIDKITFTTDSRGHTGTGQLKFSYLDDISQVGNEFAEPREKIYRQSTEKLLDTMWLLQLAEGDF